MKILALDSTAIAASVAICEDEALLCEYTLNVGNTHSETLLPMVESALRLCHVAIEDIDLFACSEGPGSFTGVRIGAATIKGLAFGKNKPCVGVSTLEALAENLRGFEGIICPAMNARRNQVYTALFESDGTVLRRLTPDMAISVAELEERLAGVTVPVYPCGDGYDLIKRGFTKVPTRDVCERLRLQSGYGVAVTALRAYREGKAVTDVGLVPSYLRPCQAEREKAEKEKNNQI